MILLKIAQTFKTPEEMKPKSKIPGDVDEYIAGFPVEIRELLLKIRNTIRSAAPDAEEKISYRMPTFALKGNLVHFAAFKAHIGFFPTPSAIEAFREELKPYATARGTVRFPLDQPVPYNLIGDMVAFRVAENLEKAKAKKKKKPK